MPWFAGEKCPEYGLKSRGKFATFSSVIVAAGKALEREWSGGEFDRTVEQNFKILFPDIPAWPGKYDEKTGYFDIFVKNPAAMFMIKPQLRKITAALKKLPGCPKVFKPVLQIYIKR